MERERIPFTNAHMFDRVMLDERICSMFLERVLGLHVEAIDYKNAEQVMEPALEGKGVRLDLFVRSREGAFDIEMQADLHAALGKRFRYYQSAIDAQLLGRGSGYYELAESYIIFVCRFDPFGCGLPVYRLERACAEDATVDVGCGSHWVALNCKAYADASRDLRGLLEYVEVGAVDPDDELVTAIDDAVERANDDRKWVDKVFSVSTIEEDIRREARYREQQIEERARAREEDLRQQARYREQQLQEELQQREEQLQAEAQAREETLREVLQEAQSQLEQTKEQARFGALTEKLLATGRIDDLERASKDDAYKESLLRELDI